MQQPFPCLFPVFNSFRTCERRYIMGGIRKNAAAFMLGIALTFFAGNLSCLLSVNEMAEGYCEAAGYVDDTLVPVQLAVNKHFTIDRDAEGELLRSSRTIVSLVSYGEGLENLQQAMWQYNKEKEGINYKLHDEMLAAAAADRRERKADGSISFVPHESLSDVYVRRADTLAVSLMEYGESYEGGVHGLYGINGRSFDTGTGKELTLDDVFTDRKALMSAIENRLCQDYPNASFMEDGGKALIKEMVGRMVGDGTIPWTLDPGGATFYFNPYLIGSYMEGIFAATILFDEQPELFRDKYRHAPGYYCMELLPYHKVRTAFARGKKGTICVGQSDSGILVTVDGKSLNDYGEVSSLRPVLVSLSNGRRYIYVDAVDAGEIWETTKVYDVSGKEPIRIPMYRSMTRRADIPDDYSALTVDSDPDKVFYIMADPNHFCMSELGKGSDVLLRECRVGADGTPEILGERQP